MAKIDQSASAAQRRAQERQQRERRSVRSNKGPAKGPTMRKKDRSGLYMVIGVLSLIAVIIVGFELIQYFQNQAANNSLKATPADPVILQQLTGVSQSTWEAVGTGGLDTSIQTVFKSVSGQPPLTGPNGHPEFFYVGGEFCPYCAAQRWAMINALSRFGTFSKLSQIQSYENNISTFSFYGSSYTSQYVDFVPVEINGNTLDGSGQQYVSLQKFTSAQQQTFNKYDAPPYFQNTGSFPFTDIGNQYLIQGATYSPTVLLDTSQNAFSWQTIASSLTNTKSPIAQGILGSANYLTAAICNLTNQQPGSVCNSSVIQQIEHSLGKTSNTASPSPLAIAPADVLATQRRVLG